jgi:hypothetical protein
MYSYSAQYVRKETSFYTVVMLATFIADTFISCLAPSSLVEVYRCFGGTYCLFFRVEKWIEEETSKKQAESRVKTACWSLA